MTILCYHSVEPGWESPLAVHPDDFALHCSWLARNRAVLPLLEAVHRLDGSGRLPGGSAALTLDDGFAALHEHALPVLSRHRLPATVFLVAETLTPQGRVVDWVDTAPEYSLQTLDLAQVREMQQAGVSFQSHSWAHHDLTQLGFDACVRDLRASRELLEDLLGHPVPLLAYPRGRHDHRVREAAASAGYSYCFALPERPERPGPHAVPRVGVYRGNGLPALRAKCWRPYLRVRTSVREVARRVRPRDVPHDR